MILMCAFHILSAKYGEEEDNDDHLLCVQGLEQIEEKIRI